MSEAGDALRSGEGGEIVIRNQSIPGSSYSAVMRALFVNPKVGEASPRGLKQAVSELKRIGVSRNLLMSKHARNLYDVKQTGSGRLMSEEKKKKNKKRICKVLRLY